jgi:hypothetical protein
MALRVIADLVSAHVGIARRLCVASVRATPPERKPTREVKDENSMANNSVEDEDEDEFLRCFLGDAQR